jgi:hypothetical protein
MQALNTGTMDLEMISNAISNERSLHSVDAQAVLIALEKKTRFLLTRR